MAPVIAGQTRIWKWCGTRAIMIGMVPCSHANCVRITVSMSAVLHRMVKPTTLPLYLIWMIKVMLIVSTINVIHSVPASQPNWPSGWIWVEAWLIAIHARISPVRPVPQYILTRWTHRGCVMKITQPGILPKRPESVSMISVRIQQTFSVSTVWPTLVTIGTTLTMTTSIIKKAVCWQPIISQVWIFPSI